MVGWIIQLFTLNLRYDSAFFLRLPALILGTVNTWMIYRLGTLIRNPRTGWYAALLHTGSLYATILVGIFILPDTPLSTFYLLSLFFMFKACGLGSLAKNDPKPVFFIPAGVFAGLAMLSKYTGVFLWAGTFLFVLFYRRSLYKNLYFWLGILVSAFLFLPVVIWNLTQDFSSFAFHSGRISFLERASNRSCSGGRSLESFYTTTLLILSSSSGPSCFHLKENTQKFQHMMQ
jgi:4-amino-4-deoxy-L-arabinose transferase-like glycosyltransferase